ncbi:MAG: FAD:protein FMN transferase [Anaerolineales bacterium]|nr:FAD:protein FMN transferase [Anaerolineales bacterium]
MQITAAAAGLGATAWGLGRLRVPGRWNRHEESRLLMGTIVNLTVLTPDERGGRDAIAAAFERMEELESLLSRFRPNSELSHLNKNGSLRPADPNLISVVRRAQEYARLTDGSFDISVEPLLAAYRRSAENGERLTADEVEQVRARIDYQAVEVDELGIAFMHEGMAINLDGIAKGYVIDRGADALRTLGFSEILVEAGGDMMGLSGEQHPWRAGVKSPRPHDGAEYLGVVTLAQSALATSGDYLHSFTQDYRQHHIVDPRSGVSPAELASTSVVAPSAMDADALSTALMVLGPRQGLQLVERLAGVEALLVDKQMGVHRSTGFKLEAA